MLSFIHQLSGLFLVETSYIYKPDEKTFVLVLHAPLVTPHNLMPLYILLPVHFNFLGNISITPEVGPNNMIAIRHSQSYQLLSSSDLQNCNKMGETYFCKGRNVLLTDLTKTCLGSLYLTDVQNIQSRCKFSIDGAQEKIFRLDSNTYMVYSLGKINTNHTVPRQRLFRLYRFCPDRRSGSIRAVTSGPWITSSRPMTARRSRSTPNGSTGRGCWSSCTSNRKVRQSPRPSTGSGPRSRASSMMRSSSTS
jgi:hypothetical protein